jgi:hypothetical protein
MRRTPSSGEGGVGGGDSEGGGDDKTAPLLTPRPSMASLREPSVTFAEASAAAAAGASGASPPPPRATADELEMRYVRRRMRENPMWSLDRGSGRNDADRLAFRKASLLSLGV